MIIKENDLRQAIREGLSEARVNHDDMGYFETVIMRFVTDYKEQPLDLKEAKAILNLCDRATPGPWEIIYQDYYCAVGKGGTALLGWAQPDKPDSFYPYHFPNFSLAAQSRVLLPEWIRRFIEAVNG